MKKSVPRGSAKQTRVCVCAQGWLWVAGSILSIHVVVPFSCIDQIRHPPPTQINPKAILRPSVLLADVDAGGSEVEELRRRRRRQPAEIAAVGPGRVVGPRPRRGAEARNVDVMHPEDASRPCRPRARSSWTRNWTRTWPTRRARWTRRWTST